MIRPEGISGVAFGVGTDGNPRTDTTTRGHLSSTLGITDQWAWVSQVHGSTVVEATAPGEVGEADAVFTTRPGLPVAVSVADCLPVVVKAEAAVGVAHAGWRGAAGGVVTALTEAMRAAGCEPDMAVIGPGIGPCCFEVGPEVRDRFPGRVAETTWGTASVDLRGAVRDALGEIPAWDVALCTYHDGGFHSHRRDGTAERQFGLAWL